MKILFFTRMPFYGSQKHLCQFGGWVNELIDGIQQTNSDIHIGYAYTTSVVQPSKEKIHNIQVYSIYEKPLNKIEKLYHHWVGYKKIQDPIYIDQMINIVKDFNPDIIQIFGVETNLTCITKYTQIPCIVHIQGIIASCYNAYFPPSINIYSILRYNFTFNEIILNNKYKLAYRKMYYHKINEAKYYKDIKYAIGRTEWDKNMLKVLSPHCIYFHINELLREQFYLSSKWEYHLTNDIIVITSTISEVMYKGLDFILKTAKILTEIVGLNFRWNVIGIDKHSQFVKFHEKLFDINSEKYNISYKGRRNADQIITDLLNSTFYIHPSYIDNSPNSLCEAQLLGVPVIACYTGGISSLIEHKKTGLLVSTNDPYETVSYIAQYYSNKNFLKELSEAEIQVAEKRHNKNIVIKELLKTYETILNKKSI